MQFPYHKQYTIPSRDYRPAGSDPDKRSNLAVDHCYPIQNTNSIHSPKEFLETHQKQSPTSPRRTQSEKMETDLYCRPQTQQHFYQAMTIKALITHLPIIPTNISIFLPSLLSSLTSISLHNLPQSKPSNRLHNELFTLLIQRKLRVPIMNQTK